MNTKNATTSSTTKATKSPRHSVKGSLRAPTSAEIEAGRSIPVTVYLTEDENEFCGAALRLGGTLWRHTLTASLRLRRKGKASRHVVDRSMHLNKNLPDFG
jgi:hypothetical protein